MKTIVQIFKGFNERHLPTWGDTGWPTYDQAKQVFPEQTFRTITVEQSDDIYPANLSGMIDVSIQLRRKA